MPIINDILNESHLTQSDAYQNVCQFLRNKFGSSNIPAYYYAQNPDYKKSDYESVLTLVTGRGLHGVEMESDGKYKYSYTPYKKIEWLQSYRERNSYIVQFSIAKTSLWLSDVYSNKDQIDQIVNLIIKYIEAS